MIRFLALALLLSPAALAAAKKPSCEKILDARVARSLGEIEVRPMERKDVRRVIKMGLDPAVDDMMLAGLSEAYFKNHFERYFEQRTKRIPQVLEYVIERDGEIVGNIGLMSVERGPFGGPIDWGLGDRWMMVGYFIAPEYWGQGIATQALAQVTRIAFAERRLHGLLAYTRPDHEISQHILKSGGFGDMYERSEIRFYYLRNSAR